MRKKSWGENKKSLLDKIINYFRFAKVNTLIKDNSTVLDLGCGYNGELLFYLKDKIKAGLGIDLNVSRLQKDSKIRLIGQNINSKINAPSNSLDYVTLLAVIEHLDNPDNLLKEVFRVLKKGGRLIITTPNISWKWMLELMANLKVISKDEINDHKMYYSVKSLTESLISNGFSKQKIKVSKYPLNKIFDFVILTVGEK